MNFHMCGPFPEIYSVQYGTTWNVLSYIAYILYMINHQWPCNVMSDIIPCQKLECCFDCAAIVEDRKGYREVFTVGK